MDNIGVFYCLIGNDIEYPELKEKLAEYHSLLAKAQDHIYYEGGAVYLEDFRYEAFRPVKDNGPLVPDVFRPVSVTIENMILAYMALDNSMHKGEMDVYQLVFLVSDPLCWDNEMEQICQNFHRLEETGKAAVEFYCQYPGTDYVTGCRLEKYLIREQMYDGNGDEKFENLV